MPGGHDGADWLIPPGCIETGENQGLQMRTRSLSKTTSLRAGTRRARGVLTSTRHFVRHYVEIVLMFLGMVVLGPAG